MLESEDNSMATATVPSVSLDEYNVYNQISVVRERTALSLE